MTAQAAHVHYWHAVPAYRSSELEETHRCDCGALWAMGRVIEPEVGQS